MIPAYLVPVSRGTEAGPEGARLDCVCPCGGEDFFLLHRELTLEEAKAYLPYYRAMERIAESSKAVCTVDAEGRRHYRLLTSLGEAGPVEELTLPELPAHASITMAKACCTRCGQELLLYDSRLHGRHARPETADPALLAYAPTLVRQGQYAGPLEIRLTYAPEDTGCPEAFRTITIRGRDAGGKHCVLYQDLNA